MEVVKVVMEDKEVIEDLVEDMVITLGAETLGFPKVPVVEAAE